MRVVRKVVQIPIASRNSAKPAAELFNGCTEVCTKAKEVKKKWGAGGSHGPPYSSLYRDTSEGLLLFPLKER